MTHRTRLTMFHSGRNAMQAKRRFVAASAATAVLVVLTGCGSSTDAATPGGDVEQIDVGVRNPGEFISTPRESFGDVGVDGGLSGAVIEGQRMAEFVVIPTELDPTVNFGPGVAGGMSTNVLPPEDLHFSLGAGMDIAIRHGALVAFKASRVGPDKAEKWMTPKSITHTVVRFRDAAGAEQAAHELHQLRITENGVNPSSIETQMAREIAVDGLQDSGVSEFSEGDQDYVATAYTAHNDYVFVTEVEASTAEKGWAEDILVRSVEAQGPMIDKFPATAPDQFDNLPIDVDGVLRLTVTTTAVRPESLRGVYGPRGIAQFSTNPEKIIKALSETKTYRQARDVTDLYMSETEEGAKALKAYFLGPSETTDIDPPPGVPDANCREAGTEYKMYQCLIQRGKYVGVATWKDKTLVYQMITAQTIILESEE